MESELIRRTFVVEQSKRDNELANASVECSSQGTEHLRYSNYTEISNSLSLLHRNVAALMGFRLRGWRGTPITLPLKRLPRKRVRVLCFDAWTKSQVVMRRESGGK